MDVERIDDAVDRRFDDVVLEFSPRCVERGLRTSQRGFGFERVGAGFEITLFGKTTVVIRLLGRRQIAIRFRDRDARAIERRFVGTDRGLRFVVVELNERLSLLHSVAFRDQNLDYLMQGHRGDECDAPGDAAGSAGDFEFEICNCR